ncbi:unnamed protein product [Parajaminaea phylloscopi]
MAAEGSNGSRPFPSPSDNPLSSSLHPATGPELQSHRPGHGQGAGSSSGAGLWLSNGSLASIAGPSSNRLDSATAPETHQTGKAQEPPAAPPRTYHFTSESATAAARASGIGNREWEMMSRGLGISGVRRSAENERVDLDLSFDFVSQLESKRKHKQTRAAAPSQHSSNGSDESVATNDKEASSPRRPRGMSETSSSLRKRPPKPLSVPKLSSKEEPKSAFSPSTAATSAPLRDGETSPLPLTPLSATRRGADSGLAGSGRPRSRTLSGSQPPTRPPTAPLPPLPVSPAPQVTSPNPSDLVRLQRQQRYGEQLHERMSRNSFLRDQLVSPMSPSNMTTPHMPSFALEAPQAPKKAASVSRRGQTESTAHSAGMPPSAIVDNGQASTSGKLGARNALGLSDSVPLSPSPLSQHGDQMLAGPRSPAGAPSTSPAVSQLSTPATAFSSLFDAQASGSGSVSSKSTSWDHEETLPGSNKLLVQGAGIPMSRGSTAPLTNAIPEEDVVDPKRRHVSVGFTRSETEEWIRKQEDTRERELTTTSETTTTTTTTTSSTQSTTEVRHLVLNTSSSSEDDEIHGTQDTTNEGVLSKVGPWPQSPLLLLDSKSQAAQQKELPSIQSDAAVGLGLGLFFQREGDASDGDVSNSISALSAPSTENKVGATSHEGMTSSRVSQAPALAPLPESTSVRDVDVAIMSSGSQSSSVDAFAWNVTPSLPAAAPRLKGQEEPARTSRFGSKLWKVVADKKAHLAASKQADAAPHSPQLRPLTLVARNEDDLTSKRELRRHSLDVSRKLSLPLAGNLSDELAQAPRTAPIPDAPTFPVAAIPTSFESSKRSSKHVRRTSRIQYIPDERKEVRLEMLGADPTSAAKTKPDFAVLADLKSPRPAPSPSGETPDMLYGHPRSRHSWGFLPKSHLPWTRQVSGENPTSPTIASPISDAPSSPLSPLVASLGPDHSSGMAEQRMSSLTRRHHATSSSVDVDAVDNAMGLRRRSTQDGKHKSTLSIPPTATIRAFSWRNSGKRASLSAEIVAHEGAKLAEVEEHDDFDPRALRQLQLTGALPPQEEGAQRMSIFVPVAALQAHLRNKAIRERAERAAAASNQGTAYNVPKKSLLVAGPTLQYSAGRLLDLEQPSRTLFFAGFLCMPWLWLIGGWWLANDGLMLTPGAEQVEFWRHQPSMDRAEQVAARQPHQSQTERQRQIRPPSPEADLTLSRTSGRLDTIYSESAGPPMASELTASALHHPRSGVEASESQSSGTKTMETAQSQHTLGSAGSRAAVSSSPSGRVLFTGDTNKVPKRARSSMGHLLSPHPEVALYHSPVRTADFSESSDSRLSVQDLAAMPRRASSRQSLSSKAFQHERSLAAAKLEAGDTSCGDDSGVDITVMDDEDAEHGRQHQDARRTHHASKRLTYRGSQLYDVAGSRMRLEHTNVWQRLAATEKFVLLNRFMAIVSTIGAFAAMGVALNAVALNF